MPIGKLPRIQAPTGPSPLSTAPRAGQRCGPGATVRTIANAPRLQPGRVSNMISLYERGVADRTQAACTRSTWAPPQAPAMMTSASFAPSTPCSSGYASRSTSVSSDTPLVSERLRAALDERLAGFTSDCTAVEGDFTETYSDDVLAALEQRFNKEDADIERFNRAFDARQAAPMAERLRASLDEHLASRVHGPEDESDFDEVFSDEEYAEFDQRFDKEDRDIERFDRAFAAQQAGQTESVMHRSDINAVHTQLLDVLNRMGKETYL